MLPVNMSEPKRHHYLPQHYLRGFADPDKPTQVWILSSNEREPIWRRRSTRSIGYVDNFYSMTDKLGNQNNYIEKDLSILDGRAAPVLKKVLRRENLDQDEQFFFAVFVADLATRGPFMRETTKQLLNQELALRTPLTEPYANEEIKKYFDRNQYHLEARHELVVDSVIGLLPLFTETILKMGWVFAHSNGSNFFITSDTPVVACKPNDMFSQTQGLDEEDMEITLPLSRNMTFIASWKATGVGDAVLSADEVSGLNNRTTMIGKKYLISPKKQFPGSENIKSVWRSTRTKLPPRVADFDGLTN